MKDLQSLLFILNLSAIMAFPRLGLSKSSLDLSLPPEIINELTQKEIRRVTPSSSTSVVMRSHPANIAHDLSNETDENSPLIQIEISDQTCVYTTLKDEALLKAFCDEYRLNPIQDNFIYIPNLNALHPEEYEKVIAELFPLKKTHTSS